MDRRFLLWVLLASIAGAVTGLVDNWVGFNYAVEILITAIVVGVLLSLAQRYPGEHHQSRSLTTATQK